MGNDNNKIIAVVAILAIVLAGAYAYSQGMLTGTQTQSFTPNYGNNGAINNPPPASVTGTIYQGRISMQVAHYDALAVTTARTEGTNVDTTWWVKRNGQYLYTGTSGDGATFDLAGVDGGYIYAQVEAKSGQSYYLAKSTTLARESVRVRGAQYFDIDNDGTNEHVFQVYCGDINQVAGGQTSADCYVNFAWYAYEAHALNSPADAVVGTGVGTVNYIEWKTTFTNTNKATLLAEIELKFNSTSTNLWQIEWVEVPGYGKLTQSDFARSQDGTNTLYNFIIGYKLDTAMPITYGANELNAKLFTVKLKTTFASTNNVTAILTLTSITSTEGTATTTDTVLLQGS